MAAATEDSAPHFVMNFLPLYHGPLVQISIKPTNHVFSISKQLLCAESPVFSAMFDGQFKEARELTAELEEMDHVISVRSFEALIHWLYCRAVKFDIEDPREHITTAMELVRLADKYNIVGLEIRMAEHIRDIIKGNPHPQAESFFSPVDIHTYFLERQHVLSAAYLHQEHPVRRIIAAACVTGYLQSDNFKFVAEAREYPSFAADLLFEVRSTFDRPRSELAGAFEDPITGKIVKLIRRNPMI